MSTNSSAALPAHITSRRATLVLVDIQRTLSIAKEMADENRFVLFLDEFYSQCSTAVNQRHGEVVKYIGDACLALFDEQDCEHGIEVILALREAFPGLCARHNITPTGLRGNVHIGEVITGEFGPEGFRDVLGKAVNTLFTMQGDGITVSEQVYRKLPSDKRSHWRKHAAMVTYRLK